MTRDSWRAVVAAHTTPSATRASFQIATSVGIYLGLWILVWWSLSVSWWLTLPIACLAGAVLVRVFIVFHDCGHGSFYSSPAANRFWGVVTGILTWTPYEHWRKLHAVHHGTAGNLDQRGVGDVWTMTVREYRSSPWWKRFAYRTLRNPIFLLFVAPLAMFVLDHRIPRRGTSRRAVRSVWFTTFALVIWSVAISLAVGFLPFLVVQLTILAVAGAIGVWLFYSQHQFDGTHWQRDDSWSFEDAALRGSAFLKLPKLLQWFTGNIGYHHIHHLNSRIPNYNLQSCHEAHQVFQVVTPLTLTRSLRAFSLKLWDESSGKLVRFRQLRSLLDGPTA